MWTKRLTILFVTVLSVNSASSYCLKFKVSDATLENPEHELECIDDGSVSNDTNFCAIQKASECLLNITDINMYTLTDSLCEKFSAIYVKFDHNTTRPNVKCAQKKFIDTSKKYPCEMKIYNSNRAADLSTSKIDEFMKSQNAGESKIEVECVLKKIHVRSLDYKKFDVGVNDTEVKKSIEKFLGKNISTSEDEDMSDWITKITIKNSNIKILCNKTFHRVKNLEHLDASKIGIENLHSKSFSNANNLKNLDLHGNKLKVVRSFSFHEVSNLIYLDLSNNLIRNVESAAFESLGKLEILDLNNNYIRSLHDEIFYPLTNLMHLHLDRNKLTIIPSLMFTRKISHLKFLALKHNQINTISPWAFDELPNLKYLMLKGNDCIDHDYKGVKITGNSDIKFQMQNCIKNFNKIFPDEQKMLSKRKCEDNNKIVVDYEEDSYDDLEFTTTKIE